MSTVLIQAMKQMALRPVKRFSPVAARILIAPIFLMAAVNKMLDWDGTVEYISAHGLPFPSLGLTVGIVVLSVGGLTMLLGYRARVGALLLFLFMIPATFVFHAFWAVPDEQASLQQIMFFKNLAIMGGLLLLINQGSGPISVDSALGNCDEG